MKILITGGRAFKNYKVFEHVLEMVIEHHKTKREDLIIVHGAYPGGADMMAGDFCRSRNIEERPYPAQWDDHGKAAGPIRNHLMIKKEKPHIVLAFPGGKGTADCTRKAMKVNCRVLKVSVLDNNTHAIEELGSYDAS